MQMSDVYLNFLNIYIFTYKCIYVYILIYYVYRYITLTNHNIMKSDIKRLFIKCNNYCAPCSIS